MLSGKSGNGGLRIYAIWKDSIKLLNLNNYFLNTKGDILKYNLLLSLCQITVVI